LPHDTPAQYYKPDCYREYSDITISYNVGDCDADSLLHVDLSVKQNSKRCVDIFEELLPMDNS